MPDSDFDKTQRSGPLLRAATYEQVHDDSCLSRLIEWVQRLYLPLRLRPCFLSSRSRADLCAGLAIGPKTSASPDYSCSYFVLYISAFKEQSYPVGEVPS